MQRLNKAKDARRRARVLEQRTKAQATTTKAIPDRRAKLKARAERKDEYQSKVLLHSILRP